MRSVANCYIRLLYFTIRLESTRNAPIFFLKVVRLEPWTCLLVGKHMFLVPYFFSFTKTIDGKSHRKVHYYQHLSDVSKRAFNKNCFKLIEPTLRWIYFSQNKKASFFSSRHWWAVLAKGATRVHRESETQKWTEWINFSSSIANEAGVIHFLQNDHEELCTSGCLHVSFWAHVNIVHHIIN